MKMPLEKKDWNQILLVPVYITLIGSHHNGKLLKKEKKGAINLAHLRTFSASKNLIQYYKDVEIHFKENLEKLDQSLPDRYNDRKLILNKKLKDALTISKQLSPGYRSRLILSWESFGIHMSHVNDNFLQEMFIPVLMDVLNEIKDKNSIKLDVNMKH